MRPKVKLVLLTGAGESTESGRNREPAATSPALCLLSCFGGLPSPPPWPVLLYLHSAPTRRPVSEEKVDALVQPNRDRVIGITCAHMHVTTRCRWRPQHYPVRTIVGAVVLATLFFYSPPPLQTTSLVLAASASQLYLRQHHRRFQTSADVESETATPLYVFVVPFNNASRECAESRANQTNAIEATMATRFWGIGNGSIIDHALMSSTTSDDIKHVREILDGREKYVHPRQPFSHTSFPAWYHAPLCHASVLPVLRRWLLPPHELEAVAVPHSAAATGRSRLTRTRQHRIVLIPAGPFLSTWTFEDIAFAQMLAPINMTRFILLGDTGNVIQRARRFRRYRKSFMIKCKTARDRSRPKMVCEAPSSSSVGRPDDVGRFHGVRCE
jgi:hypothetical protein